MYASKTFQVCPALWMNNPSKRSTYLSLNKLTLRKWFAASSGIIDKYVLPSSRLPACSKDRRMWWWCPHWTHAGEPGYLRSTSVEWAGSKLPKTQAFQETSTSSPKGPQSVCVIYSNKNHLRRCCADRKKSWMVACTVFSIQNLWKPSSA